MSRWHGCPPIAGAIGTTCPRASAAWRRGAIGRWHVGVVNGSDDGSDNGDADASYVLGVTFLAAGDPQRAIEQLRSAVQRDPAFALGHAALGVALTEAPAGTDASEAALAMTAAVRQVRGAPRQQRQHVEVLALIVAGSCSRALVLGREHLLEFGASPVVSHALERLCERRAEPDAG